jgi:hypothetical protein
MAAARAVDRFQARERVISIEREEPRQAKTKTFQIVFREVPAGDLIEK